jgi:hypothetical protein
MFDSQEEYMIKPEVVEDGAPKILHIKNNFIIQFVHDTSPYPRG